MDNFIKGLVNLKKIKPEDAFKGFYEHFSVINNMTYDELVVAKQTLDLLLTLTDELNQTEENVIMGLLKAMQTRAFSLKLHLHSKESANISSLFYINDRWDIIKDFYYDKNQKKIVERTFEPEAEADHQKPEKKGFFRFFPTI